jgi:3-dehydroquinate synthetase
VKYLSGKEKPWSMPTSVGTSSDKTSVNHSAIPRRVQYFLALGGGWTSTGGAFLAATYMRELRLAKGVSAME